MVKMKQTIYYKLSIFRENEWLPEWCVDFIDFLRYEIFYTYEKQG
mgnify:CR=1 FL=1